MKTLGDLLSKYKNLVPTDSIKKEAAIEVLQRKFDITLDKKDMSVSNNIIYLKCSPKLKAEVYMCKNELMDSLREILKQHTPRDIR